MSERSIVYLKDRESGQLVEATLLDGLSRTEVENAKGQWIPFLQERLKELKDKGVPKERWPELTAVALFAVNLIVTFAGSSLIVASPLTATTE